MSSQKKEISTEQSVTQATTVHRSEAAETRGDFALQSHHGRCRQVLQLVARVMIAVISRCAKSDRTGNLLRLLNGLGCLAESHEKRATGTPFLCFHSYRAPSCLGFSSVEEFGLLDQANSSRTGAPDCIRSLLYRRELLSPFGGIGRYSVGPLYHHLARSILVEP